VEEKLVRSKAEAKRMISGGGVDFENARVSGFSEKITKNGVAKIGKYKFVKIEISKV